MSFKQDQFKEAIDRINTLDSVLGLDKAIVTGFKQGEVCLSIEHSLDSPVEIVYLSDRPEFDIMVKRFEEENKATVYHVINTCDTLLTLLYVSEYTEDWEYECLQDGNYIACAVYDLTGRFMSEGTIEHGDCQIEPSCGALRRIV